MPTIFLSLTSQAYEIHKMRELYADTLLEFELPGVYYPQNP